MRKVFVYVEGKYCNPLSRENVSRDSAVDEILRKIFDKYQQSADLFFIYNHYPILAELNANAFTVDRHHNKYYILELDLSNRHPNIMIEDNGQVVIEPFVNYINDDLEPSIWNYIIKTLLEAEIFIAVNPGVRSAPYKVLLDYLPPSCERFWIGDEPDKNNILLEAIDFGACLVI